jgi:hypothetical protein
LSAPEHGIIDPNLMDPKPIHPHHATLIIIAVVLLGAAACGTYLWQGSSPGTQDVPVTDSSSKAVTQQDIENALRAKAATTASSTITSKQVQAALSKKSATPAATSSYSNQDIVNALQKKN